MTTFAERPTILVLKVNVLPQAKTVFMAWQSRFNSRIVASNGFVSLEFLTPSEHQKEWLIVQRFSTAEAAEDWKNSDARQKLLADLKDSTISNDIREISAEESEVQSGVTEILVTKVNPERENAFRQWSAKIHQAEASFPGFRGVYVQSPAKGVGGHWITLLQFDTIDNLNRWLGSAERKVLLEESTSLISSLEEHRVISPYAGWFASIAKVGEIPPVWKQTMLVLLVLFPIVMFELKYLLPKLTSLDVSLSTFIANTISVTLISFPMMPIAIWLLGWWLIPNPQNTRQVTLMGTALLVVLYLIEIILFWNFL